MSRSANLITADPGTETAGHSSGGRGRLARVIATRGALAKIEIFKRWIDAGRQP